MYHLQLYKSSVRGKDYAHEQEYNLQANIPGAMARVYSPFLAQNNLQTPVGNMICRVNVKLYHTAQNSLRSGMMPPAINVFKQPKQQTAALHF